MNRVLRPVLLIALACVVLLPSRGARGQVVVLRTYTPYWGYAATLHGMADLTRATAQYHVTIQKAAQERETTRRMKLETRKEELEHMKWERDFQWEMRREEQEKLIQYELERSRDRPSLTEIIAGTMLNTLLTELAKTSRPDDASSQPLKQEWLDAITFTSTGGNAGLLRHKELPWPVLLQDDRFASSRAILESQLENAREEARLGRVSKKTLEELLRLRRTLDEEVTEMMRKPGSVWLPRHHIQAMRFTRELNDALLLIENPKEAAFLLGARPKSQTVAQLVQYMRENGMKFGPATAGSERHYVALHAALAEEARQVQR